MEWLLCLELKENMDTGGYKVNMSNSLEVSWWPVLTDSKQIPILTRNTLDRTSKKVECNSAQ